MFNDFSVPLKYCDKIILNLIIFPLSFLYNYYSISTFSSADLFHLLLVAHCYLLFEVTSMRSLIGLLDCIVKFLLYFTVNIAIVIIYGLFHLILMI